MERIRTSKTVALILGAVLVVAGCGKSASTPKAAIEMMVNAAKEGDAEAFAACWDANAEQKKMIQAMGEMLASVKALDKAAEKKFGKEVWAKAKSAGGDAAKETNPFGDVDLGKVTVKEEGDKATATLEGEPKPLNLVKKDGSWKIVVEDMPEGPQLDMAVKMMKTMADAHKKVLDDIGSAKSAEDLAKKVGEEMMKAMMGSMPMPKPPTP